MMPFTVRADPKAEARVASDLEVIVSAVRHAAGEDDLIAVYLLGGYARGEGAVVAAADGGVRGFNDYDLLLLFADEPKHRDAYARLGSRLANELEIDFVDLGLATLHQLNYAPRTLFWYELGKAHRVLWSTDGATIPSLPRFSAQEMERSEGSRLMLNRGLALLWAGARLWPQVIPSQRTAIVDDPAVVRFAVIAAHKAITAAGDAALLRHGVYSPQQSDRMSLLETRPDLREWAGEGFLAAYQNAVAFRRHPEIPTVTEAAALWFSARTHHEAGLRAAETHRLGKPFVEWSEHGDWVREGRRRNQRHPARIARAIKRSLRGEVAPVDPFAFMSELPELLYRFNLRPAEDWHGHVKALVQKWHP